MRVAIFGSGPMLCEPDLPVTAPGARTWQILRTIADVLYDIPEEHEIIVYGLETERRTMNGDFTLHVREATAPLSGDLPFTYVPLYWEDFVRLPSMQATAAFPIPAKCDAVVGCASLQPCATAAAFAQSRGCPMWADIFGDPICEIQSKTELYLSEKEANDTRTIHNWKLIMPVLLRADVCSTLSSRQRFALIGQLGLAGRLNRLTKGHELVHSIPYGIFEDDLPEPPRQFDKPNFVIMWSGSFNTWMDVDALVQGFAGAVKENPRIRLLVVGGRIAVYHEKSYDEFMGGIRAAGVEQAVQFLDWQPFKKVQQITMACDVGLSIDRFTYEAVLGSRTRVVNFLTCGKPVICTTLSELTSDLAQEGYVMPFELGNADDLTRAIVEAASRPDLHDLGLRGREHVAKTYDARQVGHPLADWIRSPSFAPDKSADGTIDPANPLISYWEQIMRRA